jgi:hypothetical protein
MKKKNLVFLLMIFAVFGFAGTALAHNPRLVYSLDALPEKPIIINSPDISQAFYGRLKGWEEYFQFNLKTTSSFYWQTMVPNVKGISKNIQADLIDTASTKVIARLDASQGEWKPYHEKFANDDYFAGPSSTITLEPGTYTIKVYNENNEGKYILVVGQKESFTVVEIFKTIVNLPALKVYFDQSILYSYYNYIGLFMAGVLVGLLIIYFILKFIYRAITRL